MANDTNSAIATNKKAFFNYEITDKVECGIELKGYEVKSIRQRQVTLRDSFARIKNGEVWLMNCHITPYKNAAYIDIDPDRSRKLLLKKAEISRLIGKTESKNLLLIPLSMYFVGQRVKVQLGLGASKKKFDKRESIKKREIERDLDRARKHF